SSRRAARSSSDEIIVVDHFPGATQPLFTCYSDLFRGLLNWLPQALMPDRVGVREFRPGIKVGWHTRISSGAQLHAPCWIGQSVYIGSGAVVGPMAVIEDRSFVEPAGANTRCRLWRGTFLGGAAQHIGAIPRGGATRYGVRG